MADNDLHYFTKDGKETSAGSVDSVVQYNEADATGRGLKFKPSDFTAPEPIPMEEHMKLAALDGSAEKPVATKPVAATDKADKAK